VLGPVRVEREQSQVGLPSDLARLGGLHGHPSLLGKLLQQEGLVVDLSVLVIFLPVPRTAAYCRPPDGGCNHKR
jgi:hypothetical protein